VLSLSLNEQTKRAAFRMYPNPASEVLILANVEPQNARNNGQLVCKDLQGRIVEVFDVSLGEQLDISALQSGTYLVDWTPSHLPSTHSSTFSQKLMIR
jgi:predicted NUDIX family NTP pyrophosphohydrolase